MPTPSDPDDKSNSKDLDLGEVGEKWPEVAAELLADIELRGGICVYQDYQKHKILDCLFNTKPTKYGLDNANKKRYWQNKTSRWKKLSIDNYIKVLRRYKVNPHTQTLLRQVETKEKREFSPVTWYPLSTDKKPIKGSNRFPRLYQEIKVTTTPTSTRPSQTRTRNGSRHPQPDHSPDTKPTPTR